MELQEFISKFVETLEIEDTSAITGDTRFHDLDEWSSLSVMLLIAMFDEEFEKEISSQDIRSCSTVADLYDLIQTK